MNRIPLLIALGATLVPLMSSAEPVPGRQSACTHSAASGDVRYWLWLPVNPPPSGAPLLLFLHGAGERGSDLDLVKKHGPPKLVGSMKELQSFIVVSPQCPAEQRWNAARLKELVDDLVARHHADRTRLYVTGLSMGGRGTWDITIDFPDLFAAAAVVCGPSRTADAARISRLPVRLFHGARDEAVPLAESERMVAALKAAGATDVTLKVFPELAHQSWGPVYSDPGLYSWMLQHRR